MTRTPNKPAAGNAGIVSRLTIGHHWPGVPEPGRSTTGQGQMEDRLQRHRPAPTRTSDACGRRPPRSEPRSASFASQRCRPGMLHHRGTKITEGPGHITADLGPRLGGGVRLTSRGGHGGPRGTRDRKHGSNHAVEANRRPAGPFEAGPQSGGSFCDRALSPAAVASPQRSPTEAPRQLTRAPVGCRS